MTENEKIVQVYCGTCGQGYRKHEVRFEFNESFGDPDYGWDYDNIHQLVQCRGCGAVRYRRYSVEPEYNPPQNLSAPYNVHVYPNDSEEAKRRSPMKFGETLDGEDPLVPEKVWKMYRETIDALNSNAKTLAGGGLRATVEAICLSQGITSGNLQGKIDELANRNLLTTSQAQLLHEERYIGNAALHEMTTPTEQDLEDGLEIVEGLISTIFILPSKAEALRERRTSKSSQNQKKN